MTDSAARPSTDASQPTPEGTAGSGDVRLVTFFQPFYNLLSDRMQGLEALARRRGPDGAAETPTAFFAEAQEAGRMRDLDLQILDDALAHLAQWHTRDARPELIVSVNLSGDLVGHDDFVADMTRALRRHQLGEDRLLVDITTDTFRRLVAADGASLDRLRLLQERGVTFCLDGFTAADLDILPAATSMPVDIIKLHPRQVDSSQAGRDGLAALARGVQDAGVPVVAAGVESIEELELVRELGFEWAQGFFLGAPVAADAALSFPTHLSR